MTKLCDLARNKWRALLPALGVRAEFLSGKHGPCPICGGKDRFRFDDKDGAGTYFCNACGAGDGVNLAMEVTGRTFADIAREIRETCGNIPAAAPRKTLSADDAMKRMRRLWEGAAAIRPGDDAARYLASRGIAGPFCGDLRLHPDCPVQDHPTRSRLPAMLALIRAPNGDVTSIHRTYLENGAKAGMENPRKTMAGSIVKGSAIRLMPHDGVLGVAEGIETAFRAGQRFGIPCWSTMFADYLEIFEWPAGLRELHIFGDNDLKFRGQAAAYRLGYRAMTAKVPVSAFVHIPDDAGTDWADGDPVARAA